MASYFWRPNAKDIPQITLARPAAIAEGDRFGLKSNGKGFEVEAAAAATVENVVDQLVAEYAVTDLAEFGRATCVKKTLNTVMTLTIDATGGTFTLERGGLPTANIDYDATAAAVQAAIVALDGVAAADVLVSGPDGGPYRIEFRGALAAAYEELLAVDDTNLTGGAAEGVIAYTWVGGPVVELRSVTPGQPFVFTAESTTSGGDNKVFTITLSGATGGGTFTIAVNDGSNVQTTGNLAYDISVINLQAALDGLSNVTSGDIVVSGAPGAWVLTSAQNFAGADLPVYTVDDDNLTGDDAVWEFSFYEAPSGGTYGISVTVAGATKTATVNYNDNAAAIQAALIAQISFILSGDVTVSGGLPWSAPVVLTFGGNLASVDVESVTVNPANLTGLTISASAATTQEGGGGVSVEPVAYWKLDESSGNAVDSVGSLSLTDTNTVGTAAGVQGTARQFVRANSERLTRTTHASIEFASSFSVDAFFRLDSLPSASGQMQIASKAGGSVSTNAWGLAVSPADLITCFVYDTVGNVTTLTATAFGALSIDTWYHVALVLDEPNNLLSLYVNGVLQTSTAFSGVPAAGTDLNVGSFTTLNYMDGRIDELGIWGAALTANDAVNRYAAGSGITYPFSGVNEVQTIDTTGTPAAGSFTVDVGGQLATFDFDEAAAAGQTKLAALSTVGAGNVSVTGGALPTQLVVEFIGALAETNVDEMVIDDTGLIVLVEETTEGGPGSAATAITTAGVANDSLTLTTVQAASGVNHFDALANWVDVSGVAAVALAVDGDTLEFVSGADCLYGLAQAALSPAAIVVHSSTLKIGLPEIADDGGFAEYLPTYLRIGNAADAQAIALSVGEGVNGDGSDRLKFDFDDCQFAAEVFKSGGGEDGLPAVLLKGTHAANTLEVEDGEVGLAVLEHEAATLATLQVHAGRVEAHGATLGNVTIEAGGRLTSIGCTVSGTFTDRNGA